MRNILILCIFILPAGSWAQSYNVLLIPDSLKKNADVVSRYEEYVMEIKSPGKATVKNHRVYTVLGEKAEGYGQFVADYDKFTSINSAVCTLYDAFGKEIKHVKKNTLMAC